MVADSIKVSTLGFANMYAKRLYDDLLSNYNRLIRPVNNSTDKLTVWLNLKLSQLIEVVRSWSIFIYYDKFNNDCHDLNCTIESKESSDDHIYVAGTGLLLYIVIKFH